MLSRTRRLSAAIALALLSSACASTALRPQRYTGPSVQAPPHLAIEAADNRLAVGVDHWILPNGPGAWLKDAKWDEVMVSLTNKTAEAVSIEAVRLIDMRGVYIAGGVDPAELESRSERLVDEYSDLGVSVAIWAAPAAVTGAAIAAGSLAAAATAAALAPVAVIAAPAYYFWRKHAKAEDLDRIQEEFRRRQLSYLVLAGGGRAQGSQFFPIVPNPRSLVVDYRHRGQTYSLEIALERLRGLHVASGAGDQ
jgi:hypothetical protein